MLIKKILLLVLLSAGVSLAQQYPLVTIHDIQYVPDSLQTSDPPSPLNGDTVRVRGLVLVRPVIDPDTARRVIISAGNRWSIYVQDPAGELWGGLNVIQHDTVGTAQGTFFDLVDTAQIVEFTGKVEEFFTSTQLALITSPQPIPVEIIQTLPERPQPIELELSDFFTAQGGYNFNAEKYENMYVIFRNVITSDRISSGGSGGNFKINDGNNHFATIYNQSRYFKTGTAGEIPNYQPPLDGSYLDYVRGIVNTRTDGYYIVPMYPGDIGPVLTSPPITSGIRRNPVLVGPNQPVTVTAKIIDLDGTVADAKIFYRVNGGGRDSAAMTTTDSIFTGTIPGVPDSALVDFYIKSVDNQGNVSITPSDTVRANYFYLVLNRPLTIKDVQYSPFGSGFSGYHNYRVTLSGTVTTDTSGSSNRTGSIANRIIMQDGEGPWSGIWLSALFNSSGTDVYELALGDNITVSGLVAEDFSFTRMDSITALTINSTGNPLPEPQIVPTGNIGFLSSGNVAAEQWESVLISFDDVLITDENADGPPSNFGEFLVSDGSGDVRVELQDGNHWYHNGWDGFNPVPGNIQIQDSATIDKLNGYLYFSFSFYKLVPRYNSDFEGYQGTNSVETVPGIPEEYSLSQNYPNPFNPSTTILYSIPRSGNVVLKIYNLLGQEVQTLVDQYQPVGNYKVTFDAGSLTSGVYFYSIRSDNFIQVKKMMLLK